MSLIIEGKEYNPDGVIFDVDGTIWDSTGVVTGSWNRALVDTGFGDTQVTPDILKGLFGLPIIDILKNILPDADMDRLKSFEAVCNEYEENDLKATAGDAYEGIVETIQRLSEKYKVIIVSNCQSGYIELVIEHLKLDEYITDHVCPGDSGLLKAENIRLMCEKHNLKNPVYVGDTQMDAQACKKAEVPIIFAAYGFGKIDEPAAVINNPSELADILL